MTLNLMLGVASGVLHPAQGCKILVIFRYQIHFCVEIGRWVSILRRVVFQDLADYTVVCFKFAVSIQT